MGRRVLLVLVEPIHRLYCEYIVVGIDADLIAGVHCFVWFHGGHVLAVLRRTADVIVEDDVGPESECC